MTVVLQSNLDKIATELKREVGKAVREVAADIAISAADLAPFDSGDLADSYLKEDAIEKVEETVYLVGSDVEYAVHQEFGTSRQSAQPHLIPAAIQNRKNFKEKTAAAVRRVVNK